MTVTDAAVRLVKPNKDILNITDLQPWSKYVLKCSAYNLNGVKQIGPGIKINLETKPKSKSSIRGFFFFKYALQIQSTNITNN